MNIRNVAGRLALIALTACTAERLQAVDQTPDAQVDVTLPAPILDPVPQATPGDSIAIRGRAEGVRVLASTETSTKDAPILPAGTFCMDVPLNAGATNTIRVSALGGDGRVSETVQVEVSQNASAVAGDASACGAQNTVCGDKEICSNGRDDDCNALEDECDPACNGCIDDDYEPNDEAQKVPTLLSGTYRNMKLCPCREDWFAFRVEQGETIWVEAKFSHVAINVNLQLFRAEDAPSGTPVRSAATVTSDETIRWDATAKGTYYLRIYSPQDKAGSYTLVIR